MLKGILLPAGATVLLKPATPTELATPAGAPQAAAATTPLPVSSCAATPAKAFLPALGAASVPAVVLAVKVVLMECVCAGKLFAVKVTVCAPHTSPITTGDKPGPWPCPTGMRPRRSGRAKLLVPLPPKVVP